jgi:ATP-dependent RNA helicase DDX19/DBP5
MASKETPRTEGKEGTSELADKVAQLSTKETVSGIEDDWAAVDPNEPVGPLEEPVPAPNGKSSVEEKEVVVHLADSQGQPSLYTGVSTFEDLGLNEDLLKGIYGMGFQKPSKIQEKALPLLLMNPPKNLIGQSQSGTGKTAAFVLAMLSRIDRSDPSTQAICLTPARELARQSMDVLKEMGKYTPITTAYAIRDAVGKGEKVDAQIVIGTPGTVADLIKRRSLDVAKVKIFVLDEADNMLDAQGLGDQSVRIRK